MSAKILGGCQCGAVRYELEGPLARAYACHCRDCQKQSASAFSLSVPVVRERLAVQGPLAAFEKASDSGAVTTCWFCPTCGSRLFHTSSRSPEVATLKAGTLDDASKVAPAAHLWVSRKQGWVRLDPVTPAFETQPDDLAGWRATLMAPASGP
jgi:hypothetical protein